MLKLRAGQLELVKDRDGAESIKLVMLKAKNIKRAIPQYTIISSAPPGGFFLKFWSIT